MCIEIFVCLLLKAHTKTEPQKTTRRMLDIQQSFFKICNKCRCLCILVVYVCMWVLRRVAIIYIYLIGDTMKVNYWLDSFVTKLKSHKGNKTNSTVRG